MVGFDGDFEDVKVPWERVFTHNNAALSRNIYFRPPATPWAIMSQYFAFGETEAHPRHRPQICELSNVLQVPAVRDTLGRWPRLRLALTL